MKIEPLVVTLILSLVLPVVVGAVTKLSATTAVKNVAVIVVTAVATLINANVTDTGAAVISWNTAAYWLISLFTTITAYLGLYKPVEANASLAPDFGFGGSGTD